MSRASLFKALIGVLIFAALMYCLPGCHPDPGPKVEPPQEDTMYFDPQQLFFGGMNDPASYDEVRLEDDVHIEVQLEGSVLVGSCSDLKDDWGEPKKVQGQRDFRVLAPYDLPTGTYIIRVPRATAEWECHFNIALERVIDPSQVLEILRDNTVIMPEVY